MNRSGFTAKLSSSVGIYTFLENLSLGSVIEHDRRVGFESEGVGRSANSGIGSEATGNGTLIGRTFPPLRREHISFDRTTGGYESQSQSP